MAHVLIEELEEGHNNDILSMLLYSGVDPNDFRESFSPLIIAYQTENIEAFDLLLYYGADPNVDEGNGLTIFTSIIHLILNDITYHRFDQDIDHYNYIIKQLLLNGASMNIGNPTAYKYISDWSSMYSDNALLGIRDENDIESQQIMRQLIENIHIELDEDFAINLFNTFLKVIYYSRLKIDNYESNIMGLSFFEKVKSLSIENNATITNKTKHSFVVEEHNTQYICGNITTVGDFISYSGPIRDIIQINPIINDTQTNFVIQLTSYFSEDSLNDNSKFNYHEFLSAKYLNEIIWDKFKSN